MLNFPCVSTDAALHSSPSRPPCNSSEFPTTSVAPSVSPHLPSYRQAGDASYAPITTRKRKASKISKLTLVHSARPGGLQNPKEHPQPVPHPPVPCKKKRGIFKKWDTDAEAATQASLYQDTLRLLSNLAATSVNILNKNLHIPSLRVRNPSSISVQSYEGNSLGEIAGRIQNLEKKGFDLDLEIAISYIQFALKLDFLREAKRKDVTTLIREEIQSGGDLVGCTERQGKRWRGWGIRLVEFVGAGKLNLPIGFK